MHKRRLHYFLVKLRVVKPAYFLVAAALFFAVGLFGLRQNNLNALRLRDKVLLADKSNGDVEAALKELRAYTYSHMNTDLAGGTGIAQPVQLKYTYERLVQSEKDRVSAATEKIYNDAQRVCEQQNPTGLSGRTRVPCIEAYVKSRAVSERHIPDSLYKYSFASPRWSPDLAGISLLLAFVAVGLFAVRLLAGWWLNFQLKA